MAGCFAQLAWSAGGFALLLVFWSLILQNERWTFSVRDALYWLAVLGMITARHVDFVRYGGRTTYGRASTAHDVRRYAWSLLAASSAAWCVAQSVHV